MVTFIGNHQRRVIRRRTRNASGSFDAEKVASAAQQDLSIDGNGRGDHPFAHLVGGEDLEFACHLSHDNDPILTRGIKFSVRDHWRSVVLQAVPRQPSLPHGFAAFGIQTDDATAVAQDVDSTVGNHGCGNKRANVGAGPQTMRLCDIAITSQSYPGKVNAPTVRHDCDITRDNC